MLARGQRQEDPMERTELVTIVAAILANGNSDAEFLTAARAAEKLTTMIQTGKHLETSTWDGNVKTV